MSVSLEVRPATTAEQAAPGRRSAVTRTLRALAGRLGGAALVLFAVATLSFFAVRLIPGDPVDAVLGGADQSSTELREQLRAQLGFDRPLWEQYLAFLGGLVRGQLGTSYQLRQPVETVLFEVLGSTVILAVASLALAWVIAVVLALWSARSGRAGRLIGQVLEITAAAVPHFWLGTMLILAFSLGLGWLPATSGGRTGFAGLVLPVVTLAIPLAGFLGQLMRESIVEAMDSPFATSARARGESEIGLTLRHALRHAALPGLGLSGWAFGSLISGAVVVETLFSRQGLGRTLLNAVLVRDVPMVIGAVLLIAVLYVLVLLIVDVLERLIDPRLRA